MPGGCAIGARPIDFHLAGLKHLGAQINQEHGYIEAVAPNGLKGAEISFERITVTGTEDILMAAVLVVVVFRLLHLPALIGYLLIGIAVGPSGFGLATSTHESQYLAEFGVVFLMFTIGLEFSLPRLFQMRRVVLGLGGL